MSPKEFVESAARIKLHPYQEKILEMVASGTPLIAVQSGIPHGKSELRRQLERIEQLKKGGHR